MPTAAGDASRARLRAIIEQHPGLSVYGIRVAAGLGNGTVRHHLSYLRGQGAVVCYTKGVSQRYFPAGWTGLQAAQALVDNDPHLREVLRVAGEGRLRQVDLMRALPWPRATVQHALQRLVAAGTLQVMRQGRSAFYELAKQPPPLARCCNLLDAQEDLRRLENALKRAEQANNAAVFYSAVRHIAGVPA
jgi:predicted transcriptional regulator